MITGKVVQKEPENRKEPFRLEAWERLIQDPENMAAALFIIAMAVYYLWRMLYLTPWYDELYTYYYFISRGPLYAAIHWPLPNNHVGYSVLSAVLNLCGNPYIGLRGVSWLCAVSNLIILYRICKSYFTNWLSLFTVMIYSGLQLVNQLSVQGRGYTLSTLCFLLSVKVLADLSRIGYTGISRYVYLVMLLVLGLYTVPSSIYWVIPVCFATVLFLTINGLRIRKISRTVSENKYWQQLINLIVTGLIAAIFTLMLYMIIWLAVGSNLLMKDKTGSMYGMGHLHIILHAPLTVIGRGIEYMISSPYIQSVPRQEFLQKFWGYIVSLDDQFVPGAGIAVFVIIVLATVIMISGCVFHFEESRTSFRLIFSCTILFMPLMLIAQSKLPYYRVFSYYGIVIALSCTVIIRHVMFMLHFLFEKHRQEKNLPQKIQPAEKKMHIWTYMHQMIPVLLGVAFLISQTLNPAFFAQLGTREDNAYLALLMAHPQQRSKLCVCDVDQKYLLKFGWNMECDNTQVEGSDCVILDRNMTKAGYQGEDLWKYYQTYETIPWGYIRTMHVIYENDDFILYVK